MYQPTRQITFGSYTFPLTFQETSRTVSLALDKKNIPFNYGESVALNSSAGAREIVIGGAVGSLLQGSSNNILSSASDLEAERRQLAALQLSGRQALFVGTDQFIYAFLESFEHKFFADAFGFRYADWTLKFFADDPRYVSTTVTTVNPTSANGGQIAVATNGNVRAYPVGTFTSPGGTVGPYMGIVNASGLQSKVTFSLLTMAAGSRLSIACDPRPNVRSACAVYTPSGGASVNALQYAKITDFSNDYDLTEWFPFINPPQVETGLKMTFGAASGAGWGFTASWVDRWI